MAISRISAHSAQASSVSITTPTAGDLILVFSHRDGSTAAPTLATGFTDIASGGANTNAARIAYKISNGTETTSGTWTNATSVAVGVYRGVDPSLPIGNFAVGGSASVTLSFTGFTGYAQNSTSWIVGFAGHRTATNVGTNNPTGLTSRSSAVDVAIFDSGGTANNYTTATATVGANSGWRTYTVELREPHAMRVRYVNTSSTAGGDGTTNNTGGATRAFASLNEALASLVSLGTLRHPYTIYCEGTAADTTACTQTSWNFVTNPTDYVLVTTDQAAGKRHSGQYDTTKYRLEVTDNSVIYCNQASHVRLEGLQGQITCTTSTSANYNVFRLATANNASANIDHRISDCIAKGVVSGGTDNISGYIQSDPVTFTGTCKIWNCIAYGCYAGFNSDGSTWAQNNLYHYNCTAYGNEFNFMDLMRCVNCLSANPTTGAGFGFLSTGTTGHSNNASDDNTAGGTNARINQTFSFVNAAGGNFQLTAGDSGARNFGLSDPASGLFLDDITGTTRAGSWDIGAFEAMAASMVRRRVSAHVPVRQPFKRRPDSYFG